MSYVHIRISVERCKAGCERNWLQFSVSGRKNNCATQIVIAYYIKLVKLGASKLQCTCCNFEPSAMFLQPKSN